MKLYLVLILIGLTGCKSNIQPPLTNSVIDAGKFQQILKDIHLADALANREGELNGTAEALSREYYQSVFKKHGINADDFYASMNYYMYEVSILDSLYANIITEISKEQALIQAQ